MNSGCILLIHEGKKTTLNVLDAYDLLKSF